MYNEISRLWPLISPGQGKKTDEKIDTNLEIAKITGTKKSYVEKIRTIAKVDVRLLHVMVEKNMSVDAGLKKSKELQLLNELNKQKNKKKFTFGKDNSLEKSLKEEVIESLSEGHSDVANLVKADLLSPMDAYKKATQDEVVDEKKPKCDCPFCSSKIEIDDAIKISKLTLEQIEDLLNILRNDDKVFAV